MKEDGPRATGGRAHAGSPKDGPVAGESFDEAALVEGLRAARPDALKRSYDRYSSLVYEIGIRFLKERADAEDLVQEVFAGLYRAVQTYEGRGPFPAWLRKVAVRTALMKLRRNRTAGRFYAVQLLWHDRPPHPETTETHRLDIEAALETLNASNSVVFWLKEVEGYSHEEIAQLMGISVGAAKARLHRARKQLRAHLSEPT